MKIQKIFLILLAILIVCLIVSGYGSKLFNYYFLNGVLDYGSELTIYQILGNDTNVKSYPELANYTFKKAKVRELGSTAHEYIHIGNNDIVFIGNRNLIKINNILYVYSEK